MAESSDFNLILTDFLKYVPEPKRHDYELMLRRCNFSDPADPMFPVMLFLLFFQDNLADRMEELTEEVTRRGKRISRRTNSGGCSGAEIRLENRNRRPAGGSADSDCFRRFLPDNPGASVSR